MEHKHYSATKPISRNKKNRIGTIVFVIISIVLLAGIAVLSPIGDYLMMHVISPIMSCNTTADDTIVSALKQQESTKPTDTPSPTPSEKAHQVINIEEIPFYILQMGTFTDAKAADRHAGEIARMGAGGVVYKDGSFFRVFAAAYSDESSLMNVQSQVRADGFEATPYITESRAVRITLDGDRAAVDAITEASQLMNSIPSNMCALSISFDKKEIQEADLYEKLRDLQTSCNTVIDKTEQIDGKDISRITDLLKKYVQNISTFLDEHDTIQTEMISGALKHLQISVIVDYILFFDQK